MRSFAALTLVVLVAVTCRPQLRTRAPAPPPASNPSPSVPAVAATPASAPPALPSPSAPPAEREAEYRVGPGDVLEVTVIGQAALSRTATVQTSGVIGLPLLNEVAVAGLTVSEIQRKVTTLLERDFLVNPQVEVRVREYQSQFVMVLGEINAPGRKVLRGGSRLVDVLVESGGFTPRASGEVAITRAEGSFEGGGKVLRLRLGGAFSVQDYVALEVPLRHGDVVTALARSYVTVEGEVQHPGRYAIEGELTVTGAISTAGGLTRFGSSGVRLRRIDPATGRVTVTKVDLKAVRSGKKTDPLVAPNDVISVPRRLF